MRPRILVVDDQSDALRLLQLRLRSAGLACVAFQDAPSALEFLSRELVDLIITDVMMPGVDGIELCRRVKADSRTSDIPVLFLTANTETDDKVRGLGVGGHDYLSKPVDQQELVARTRAALRVKHLQDELKKKLELQQEVNRLHQGMLSEHWQKTLGDLASSLAHEINNPLAVALGNAQLLCLETGFSPEVRERLLNIDQSLQRAARQLRSLLFIAQSRREAQTIQVSELVEDLLALVNYRLVIRKVTVKTMVPKSCRCYGVASELGRALLFIVDNAVEATIGAANPSLTIVAERSGPDCCIRIVDNGEGVRPELRRRVFEPFFTTKGPPHNGIGLYLAEEILRQAGGKIECVSPSPLGNTEFTVCLPIDGPGFRAN
ncbi:MAG: hybrid sensor histidine kinase/response regulator [Verrucomicrobiales bacterium]|nr:hybrid sensor histidine kinase/response regulator [Verrucomicrobiales bacterium]